VSPPVASSAALRLASVSKRFGHTRAVVGVDLEVADGELLALVGPSGCGKSTLLRIVAGLTAADTGTVHIGEQLVDDGSRLADPEHRDVGLVFQEHALFPHMTVGDNLMFGLRGLTRDERRVRRDHWLEMIGLGGNASRYPHELSGGERQRVALARALAPHPRLMLLDEPFASLDPNRRAQIRTDVVRLLRDTGTAAVFVTHDQQEAMAVGDRVAVMRHGAIEQLDTPSAVFHRPVNRFVAGFMGEASLLAVDAGTGLSELGVVPVTGTSDGTSDGAAAALVVRPTDVVLHGLGQTAGVPGEVIACEFRGATRLYTLRLPSGATVAASVPHTVELEIGSTVGMSLSSGHHVVVSDHTPAM
jgi:iron(III) transport system ATP-binding protein